MCEGVEEVTIQVPWGVIALKCWYSAKSSPVLVVHGLCENAGAFDRLIPLLSKDFFFVVVDLPGHGQPWYPFKVVGRDPRVPRNIGIAFAFTSNIPPRVHFPHLDWAYGFRPLLFRPLRRNVILSGNRRSSPFPQGLALDFMHYVFQLQRVVKHFQWKRLCLMGHSFGAHLLEFYAATYTGKVEKLILLDAISPTPVPREFFLIFHHNQGKDAFEQCVKERNPTLYTYDEAVFHVANERMSKLESQAAEALLERCLEKRENRFFFTTDSRIRREIRPAVEEDVILEQLVRIRCPVLVILANNSEQSRILNSPGYYSTVLSILQRAHADSKVVRVAGNHCVHNNQPEIIAPLVNRFLTQREIQPRCHL